MINRLLRFKTTVGLFFLTLFYSQTILAAYEPWKSQPYYFSTAKSFQASTISAINEEAHRSVVNDDKVLTKLPLELSDKSEKKEEIKKDKTQGENVGGPTQPEMTSFQSVNNSNMVDLFSGDFSYNIPLLDVGGYPVNLFYRSGITMDQEASWVGLGWNINPGTITRNLRGLPDDFNGGADAIQKTTYVAENKTIGGSLGGDIEIFGLPINVGANVGAFCNSYRGWGVETGLHASIIAGSKSMGSLTGGLSLTNNSQTGVTISPSLSAKLDASYQSNIGTISGGVNIGGGFSYNARSGLVANLSSGLNLSAQCKLKQGAIGTSVSPSSSISFASPSYTPLTTIPLTNNQFTFTVKVGAEFWGTHENLYLSGYVSKQFIAAQDRTKLSPAYGYLNYQNANDNNQALLDFNREKDIVYRDKPEVPNIAIPSYTYDIFNISGEGSGGMFRGYRSDIGYVHDPYITTKDQTDAASFDFGIPVLFHGGADLYVNHANTTTGAWVEQNPLAQTVKFRQPDSVFEASYFRNPGEKSINPKSFYTAIGDDDVVTAQLYQAGNGPFISSTNYLQRWKNKSMTGTSYLNSGNAYKNSRDKRTQVISYLTAAETARLGLDTVIYNYGLNQWGQAGCSNNIKTEARINSFRQPNHLSEIDVLNSDGKRYVYGLPVYNLFQESINFATNASQANKSTGMVKYSSTDVSENNQNGKDHFFEKEIVPAYAHSFLLTGILSPDYVDVTGNGVSSDDLGDAIKFNYTKSAGKDSAFGWRTPYVKDSVSYNEGLQTYSRDDRGNFIYGEKEMWFLNSVESKNMIAVFYLQNRSDLKPISETGFIDTTNTSKAKCLKEIDLYSKADFLQNGTKAKPIKTVHFYYTYELCKGVNKNFSQGKLTLKKVWFTYNGNEKGVKNPYQFFYNTANPSYTNTAYDSWGNYKNPLQNPRSVSGNLITNSEYPYSLQDSGNATANAGAWTMDSLTLPSSGSIKIKYESDDYAYVQNKRAMQMFNVVGLSRQAPASFYSANADNNISNFLYSSAGDNLYVSVRVQGGVTSAKDAFYKYLDGFQKVYFKLKVQMPTDIWGSGYEYVPVYGIVDFSSVADSSKYGFLQSQSDIIWIKIIGINSSADDVGPYSPLAQASIQFLRLNLPSKAYPGAEIGDNLDFKVAVNLITLLGKNLVTAFDKFDNTARDNGMAVKIDTGRSLIRLDNPIYKKYGGGLRVKSIKIYDNWKNIAGAPKDATYGQEYDYTTIKNINGIDRRISSGVACWEPMMGGEENPFKLPIEYQQQVSTLAPVTLGYTELPIGETFFPAPSVGYSQVRIRSIHASNIKSATGYEETKFYTTYDFPTITDNSMFTPDTKKRYKPGLGDFLRIRSYHYLAMSQGFKIELNDMNGKIKYQASYPETDSVHPINSTQYYYHVDDQNTEFKHLNNTVKAINQSGVIDSAAIIGKDVELMMDMREQHSITEGADKSINVDVFPIFIFVIAIPSFIPMPQKEETKFQSVATTKIIQRYGLLDSVVAIDKGSKVSTENLLYDSETGDVLLTRTRNEFNDSLYNFTYPAHWAYSGMGEAYQNNAAVYSSDPGHDLKILGGLLQNNSKYPGMIKRFETGDEILASGKFKTSEVITQNCSGQNGCPTPIFSNSFDTTRIWAVDSKKVDSTSSLGLIFIDRYGNPVSADSVSLKIIRSGHRNLLNVNVGQVTMLNSPLKIIGGKLQLQIDSNKTMLECSAQTFKDIWKLDTRSSTCINYTITMDAGKCTGSYNYTDCNGNTMLKSVNRSDCGSTFTFDVCALKGSMSVGQGMSFKENGPCLSNPSVCFDKILGSLINPYTYGIIGNWRARQSFVYNGKRREQESSTTTNIRNNGAYQNWLPYWSFGSNYLSPTTDTSSYVWKSESTLFNRKGFELENKDPLGRYNSGAYGYANSLPVNVVQNSSYKNQFFDGFEDYNYINQNCPGNCNTARNLDFITKRGVLDSTMSHTGKYSLKVNALDSVFQDIALSSINNTQFDTTKISIHSDGSTHPDTLVTPMGNGLSPYVDYNSHTTSYTGYIQAAVSGYYVISSDIQHTNYDPNNPTIKGYELGVNGTNIGVNDDVTSLLSVTVFLTAGQKNYINVSCHSGSYFTSSLDLRWQRLGSCNTGNVSVPTLNLYQNNLADTSVKYDSGSCIKMLEVRTDSSALISSFKPAQGSRMLFSSWVKERRDCLCSSYDSNAVYFRFARNGNTDTTLKLKPIGDLIEGWQRYENVIDIPLNATSMRLIFKSMAQTPVYFDDLRMLPYNANMKSFVYDPISLRLVAELDENNYATFYEYDNDGTLTRVKKETERGIQTIKETRSSLSKLNDQ